MRIHRLCPCLVPAMLLVSGCASIENGSSQRLTVQALNEGVEVSGASCKLQNGKGTWFVTTPGLVTVNRAYGDLSVHCSHEKHGAVTTVVESSFEAWIELPDVLAVFSLISASVDAVTEAAYDYPRLISVEFGNRRAGCPCHQH